MPPWNSAVTTCNVSRRIRRKRIRGAVGAPPGAFPSTPHAHPTTVSVTRFSRGHVEAEDNPDLSKVKPGGTREITWVNVEGLQDHDLLQHLGREFHIHPLALEDALVSQRPKLEAYPQHMLFLLHMPSCECHEQQLEFEQVAIFYGEGFVVTIQDGSPGDCFDNVRRQLAETDSNVRLRGPDYLAYRLMDAIIDHYFPLVDHIEERIDRLEEQIFGGGGAKSMISDVRSMKHDIAEMDRRIRPVMESLRGREQYLDKFTEEETRIEIRDCLDHSRQLVETLAMHKDSASGLMNDYLSQLSYKTNEVMRALTIITTIFMPLTFIAGVYGMNFDHMPELHWRYGYPATLSLMLISGLSFFFYFKKRGWLNSN